MQDHTDAWPFIEPVDSVDVPDYYKIIKDPIGKNTVRLNTELSCHTFFVILLLFLENIIVSTNKINRRGMNECNLIKRWFLYIGERPFVCSVD